MEKKFKIDWTKTMSKIKEQEQSSKNNFKDERIYTPQYKDDGIAQAIIRFLPSKDTEIPFIGVYSHSFKGPGGWYIENCPTTLKKECPVCKNNSSIWDDDPDTVRIRKRKLSYYANILVKKDPLNPDNEGKVFLFRFGKKIFDKIMAKMTPEDGSIEDPIMIFDYYSGADFKLIVKKVAVGKDKMPNYDECKFYDKPTSISDDESVIEKIHDSLYSLKDFVEDKNFKDFSELEEKFVRIVGTKITTPTASARTSDKVSSQDATGSKSEAIKSDVEASIFDGTDDDFLSSLEDDK